MINYGKHSIDLKDLNAVKKSLKSKQITQGPLSIKFGQSIANYCGSKYGLAVSSGTSALHLALLSLNLKKMMR